MKHMASGRRNSRSKGSSAGRKRRSVARGAIRYVLCVENNGYPTSLDVGKFYRCLHDSGAEQHSMRRVVDESGEDYLYPRDWFLEVRLPLAAKRALSSIVG